MNIKYFNVATLIATGLFIAFFLTARYGKTQEYLLFYLISLVVIWGSYFILSEKKIDLKPKEDKHGGSNIFPYIFVLIIIIILLNINIWI
jgi:low temperature requirement protein LtrA|tara:strand:+ start:214 stop:483 length:270 start_codon:yes stop_codon:yes gene_type:complete